MPENAFRGIKSCDLDDKIVGRVTLEETQVRGYGGVASPRLLFPIMLEVLKLDNSQLVIPDLVGRLTRRGAIAQTYLAPLRQMQPRAYSPRSMRQVVCDLTPELLEQIETTRSGGDLHLDLELWGIVLEPTLADDSAGPHKQWGKSYTEIGQAASTLGISVPRSVWLDNVLAEVGYGRYQLLEFNFSGDHIDEGPFRIALSEVDAAAKAFAKGEFPLAWIRCRNAIDAAASAYKLDLGGDPAHYRARVRLFRRQVLEPALGRPKAELTANLLDALWRPLSSETKPGPSPADRGSAQLALNVTGSLIAYMAKSIGQGQTSRA